MHPGDKPDQPAFKEDLEASIRRTCETCWCQAEAEKKGLAVIASAKQLDEQGGLVSEQLLDLVDAQMEFRLFVAHQQQMQRWFTALLATLAVLNALILVLRLVRLADPSSSSIPAEPAGGLPNLT